MDTNNHYSYSPLSGPRSTRLIMLHASKGAASPLSCKLVEVSIDAAPVYQALSYTWNGEAPSEPMTVTDDGNASHRSQTLVVTPNCAAALRLLRKRIKLKDRVSRVGLWVDAVCINQSSNDEKSAQVAMMATIFRNARDVVVWLGEEWTPRSRRDLLPARIVGPFVKPRLVDFWIPVSFHLRPLVTKQLALHTYLRLASYNIAMAKAITDFLLRVSPHGVLPGIQQAPYWTRAWTVQEFAHLSATLLCLDAGLCHFRRLKVLSDDISWSESISTMEFHAECVGFSESGTIPAPHDFWEGIFNKKATEPRDKVFAMRELFPSILGGITVDYSRPVKDLFTEATRRVIVTTNRLENLHYSVKETLDADDFPSWAVDWAPGSEWSRLLSWFRLRPGSNSSRGAEPVFSFSGDGKTLFLSGTKIGQVGSYVGERIELEGGDERGDSDPSGHPPTDNVPFLEALRRIVLASHDPDETLAGARFWSLWDLMSFVLASYPLTRSIGNKLEHQRGKVHPGDLLELLAANVQAHAMLFSSMRHGRLFFTEDGRAGAAIHTVQSGDSICVFAGVKAPFIVRQKGTGWVLVSPAMLSGAMIGEMWSDKEEELSTWGIV
ncbi:HET-domain-containing protein [Colletotrichum falcatum]|nr:HET-domain-containing protein [Colletotrichum falcatum]